jgi:hypothetical protein
MSLKFVIYAIAIYVLYVSGFLHRGFITLKLTSKALIFVSPKVLRSKSFTSVSRSIFAQSQIFVKS